MNTCNDGYAVEDLQCYLGRKREMLGNSDPKLAQNTIIQ